MALYVTVRDAEKEAPVERLAKVARDAEKKAPVKRLAKTAASALLAYGLADGVAPYVGGSPTFAAVLIMGFGLIILDVGTALLLDRDFIKELVRKKLGGGDKK